jgi:ADP-ribose pyrophosphatase
LLDVRRDRVRLPDGGEAVREYVVHGGAVLIVPVLPDGRLVVERQFRYPLARVFLEFPAGKIDPGEDPLETARREMIEETGYAVGRLTPLAVLHPVISYSTEEIRCYVGEELRSVGARLDHGEFLEVETRTLDELLGALDAGEITDAKTVSALLLYARRLRR